jgi:hypothetical protein
MDEPECKSGLEQLTNGFFFRTAARYTSERAHRFIGQWRICSKEKDEICLNSGVSKLTNVSLKSKAQD